MALHFFPLDGFLTSVSAMTYHSPKRILAAIHEVLPTANLSTTNDLFLVSYPDPTEAVQLNSPVQFTQGFTAALLAGQGVITGGLYLLPDRHDLPSDAHESARHFSRPTPAVFVVCL